MLEPHLELAHHLDEPLEPHEPLAVVRVRVRVRVRARARARARVRVRVRVRDRVRDRVRVGVSPNLAVVGPVGGGDGHVDLQRGGAISRGE